MTDVVSPSDVSYPADGFALFPDRSVVALRVNGELKDLATVVSETDAVEPVTVSSPDGLAILRHSTAHVLAQAVQRIRPQSNLGIGPPIEDGFYYDFGVDEPFTPEDLKSIKKEMERIVRENQRFVRRVVTADEARVELADEPFKLELVDLAGGPGSGADAAEGASAEIGAGELTIYDNVTRDGSTAWKDLCRGPHVPGTRMVGNGWDLTRVAAAYWRGSEKNPQLQRIYGTAWPSKDELRAYQERLAEAARRDHRKLGVELDLFSFPDEIGPGLSVFHPKGGIIRYEIERYMREQLLANDYEVVNTPHITKGDLFMTSGHLQWYADGMYPPMKLDEIVDAEGNVTRQGQEYYLKPMNCPFHNLIFRSRGRSYRELPLRLSEFGSVYRYEKSGTLSGLTRVRGMTQDDTHIYVTPDQVEDELVRSLEFVLQTLRDYGLNDFYLELSTKEEGNPKFIGDDALWQQATETLRRVAEGSGLELVPDPGGAAFYGPKISVQARDAIGRTWQMSTIQLDFNQPERFELEYTGPDGEKHRPVMIHRALFGSIERFFAILLEHYAGAFPVWLAPVQVVAIPVADDYAPYLQEIVSRLRKAGVRAELDRSDDRMQKKIRTHTTQKVPLQLIAGEQDRAAGTVSFRFRDGSQTNGVPVDEAVERILAAIANRTLVDTAEHLSDTAEQLA
ncbi:threonine--tRNA ligase [Microbacterium paludicola]|uniref:Threonine--tRNA ligase n=1 Tax=Microbacterium paludicola TaxID=300019 RepID=A0ABU1HXV3_9MICO|nr:threonine--tRNA ligase [Microbacterium paludicola]APF33540.1 threonine--tRNA ligase [Microbacterium paludicola]MDR6166107.1 threonyl-tRNA synthetase [Microbacterium paludicola]